MHTHESLSLQEEKHRELVILWPLATSLTSSQGTLLKHAIEGM